MKKVEDIIAAVDTSALMAKPLPEWTPILAEECQVYVIDEQYLAKRFDQINYKFCEKEEAEEVLVDNLYAFLRFKYFPKITEEIAERINKIVKYFCVNLKTTLRRVTFDKAGLGIVIQMLPDYCIAFRNGVWNFKDNKWLFKYTKVKLEHLHNNIYAYDPAYAILWYLDYEFEALPIDLKTVKLAEFIEAMKDITKTHRNYCFELLYNISHTQVDKFDINKLQHLCEILGYTILQSFAQSFVLLIGSGHNGKNSLFDGCFTNRVIPRPASNDLDSIEQDRFITGALNNKAHNIFLETSAKTYTESKMIKALTGSMYQTIEQKGINKYAGIINCKYLFAGNDQEKIKFSDSTTGFRRRINMFEIFYQWDPEKRFMKKGDYYDTSFSDSLSELKEDITNTTAYLYFAMYGIMLATSNFTKNFKFTYNDWNLRYTDVDFELKEKLESITAEDIGKRIKLSSDGGYVLYDDKKRRLVDSPIAKGLGYDSIEGLIKLFLDPERYMPFLADNDILISVRELQTIVKDTSIPLTFTQSIRKLYGLSKLDNLYNNKPYVKLRLLTGGLRIVN